jgi:alpha-L-fucosidase 2
MRLSFDHREVSDYRRCLDLSQALYTCDYGAEGAFYHREGFLSFPHKIFFQKLTCTERRLHVALSLYSDVRSAACVENGVLILRGYAPVHSVGATDHNFKTVYDNTPNAVCNRFEIRVAIRTDGDIREEQNGLCVQGASYIEIYQSSDTSFVDWKSKPVKDPSVACAARLAKALEDGYEKAKQLHLADHGAHYGRAELVLDRNENSALPTDERVKRFAADAGDAELCALYFHYGRYLMLAAEREGSAPGNLQGIWNWDRKPIWECDMHLNINLQMNYWGAESTNLSECHLSLLQFLKGLCESGKRTARDLHGCRGSCAYSTTDIWCKTTPTSGCAVWGYWPLGEAWLAMHIFDRYEYTKDLDFLAEYYDVLKENALFLYDWTYYDKHLDAFVTSPSTSPEHFFSYPNENGERKVASVSKASTADLALIREIFSDFVKASTLLERDRELCAQIAARAAQLLPLSADEDGVLREWFCDFEPRERGHRHFSHLIGVYPGDKINAKETPALFAAAKKALDRRLQNGGGSTGWSLAWAMALAAKFGDASLPEGLFKMLFANDTSPNLLDYMYVEGWERPLVFQIDANFGVCAATAEMLLQSTCDEIRLLPCLPAFMKNGTVRGLRAKGALTVSLSWENGALLSAELLPECDGKISLCYGKKHLTLNALGGERIILSATDFNENYSQKGE